MDDVQSQLDSLTDSVLGPTDEVKHETAPTQTNQTEPAPEQPSEPAPKQDEPVAAPAAVPEEPATVEEDEPEEEDDYNYQYPAVQPEEVQSFPFDISQIPQNEDGTLDANALAAAIAQHQQQNNQAVLQQAAQMVQDIEEKRTEERLWNKAFEAHPELRKDKALAEEVNALRFGLFAKDINDGKQARMLTPRQAYDRINKRFSQVKADSVRQATESVKVQDSVYQEPVGNAAVSDDTSEQALFRKLRSSNRAEAEAAQDAILRKRLFGE